ncbi:MAG: FtsX-like permease family protein [Balneolaceae bacterium]|nr:FtsX-like permease family protein [Balneolaceae bacterium]
MFKNYLKIVFRNLYKGRGYSFFNIFSLVLAITPFLLVLLFILQETSYDNYHINSDKIYRVTLEGFLNDGTHYKSGTTSPLLAQALDKEFSQITETTRLLKGSKAVGKHKNNLYNENNYLFADPDLFEFFDIEFIAGDAKTALVEPYSMVVTEKTAQRYFKGDNPIGKTIEIDTWINFASNHSTDRPEGRDPAGSYTITGVVAEMPFNSHFSFDFLLSMSTLQWWEMYGINLFNYPGVVTYALIEENSSIPTIRNRLPEFIEKYHAAAIDQSFEMSYEEFLNSGKYYKYDLQPLEELYLGSNEYRASFEQLGSINTLQYLLLIAVIILLIGVINFVNITTARSMLRAKEIGIRKAVGSSRLQLVTQFLIETGFITLLSTILALIAALFLLPIFNSILEIELSVDGFMSIKFIGSVLAFIFFCSILAGIYPALIISSYEPSKAFREVKNSKANIWLRSGLSVFQFGISAVLIIVTIVIARQVLFMQNSDYGYRKSNVIILKDLNELKYSVSERMKIDQKEHLSDLPFSVNNPEISQFEYFKEELLKHHNIKGLSGASDLIAVQNTSMQHYRPEDTPPEEGVKLATTWVHYDFFKNLDVDVAPDHHFSKIRNVAKTKFAVINRSAAQVLGLKDPLGSQIIRYWPNAKDKFAGFKKSYEIVGVVNDFHYQSLHSKIKPTITFVVGSWNKEDPLREAYVILGDGNLEDTITYLQQIWKKFEPEKPLEYSFVEDSFDKLYAEEKRLSKLLSYLTALAILLACMGVFSLSIFTIQNRKKEIAIRKVMGASLKHVLSILTGRVFLNVIIAIVLFLPVAIYVSNRWLENFAYKIDPGLVVYLASALVLIVITSLTVFWHTLRAARENPVNALTEE